MRYTGEVLEGVKSLNLLSKNVARCDTSVGWSASGGSGITFETTLQYEGAKCLKGAIAAGRTDGSYIYDILSLLDTNKYYLISLRVRNGNTATGAKLVVNCVGDGGTFQATPFNATTTWQRQGIAIKPSEFNAATNVYAYCYYEGAETQYAYWDCFMVNAITKEEYALCTSRVAPASLLNNYPFTYGSDILFDRSRYSNNGAFTGLAWSKLPSGLYVMPFLNAAHLCTIPQNGSINDVVQKTFSCWVYYNGVGGGSGYGQIFNKTGSGTAGYHCWIEAGANKLVFRQYFSTNLGSWETASSTMTLSAWHYIQISYDNSSVTNNPVICINGVSKSVTETTTPVGTAVSDAAADLIIGNRSDAARFLNGYIAMPKIWSYLRTEAQALAEYTATKYLFGL